MRLMPAVFATLALSLWTVTRALAQQTPGLTMSAKQEEAMAACLGVAVEDYRTATNPTGGEVRMPTKEEQKAQQAALKKLQKVPPKRQMECNQSVMTGTAEGAMAMAREAMASAGADVTEAPGKAARLSATLAADLTAGKTVVRDIDWVAREADLSEAGAASLKAALDQLGPALREAGGAWRLDFYLDRRYGDDEAAEVAGGRFRVVVDGLNKAAGQGALTFTLGKPKLDADPRLEIVRPR